MTPFESNVLKSLEKYADVWQAAGVYPVPETDEDRTWAYLFHELPFIIRHRWGGDWKEFREGVKAGALRMTAARERDNQ